MRVAILGASGRLGRRTVQQVLDAGAPPPDVFACVRDPGRVTDFDAQGVTVRHADYDDPVSLEHAFQGVERLLLVPSMAPPLQRVRQYEHTVDAARAAGVGHLLHYGLVPTDLRAPFPVVRFLLYAEQLIRHCGLGWTILRNGPYLDEVAAWAPTIRRLGTIPYPTGEGRCPWITRDDLARAGAAALLHGDLHGEVLDLVGPEAIDNAALCRAFAAATGADVTDRRTSADEYVRLCVAEGEDEAFSRLLASLYETVRRGLFDVPTGAVERLTGTPAETPEACFRRLLA